jgi:hypothetical protein
LSEHGEQMALFEWSALNEERVPELKWMFSIPNGAKLPYRGKGKRRFSPEAMRLKDEGLKPGVPDVFLSVARQGYHGFYIEMKVGYNKPTEYQNEWLKGLAEQGYKTSVCYGMQAAKKEIVEYLELNEGEYIDMI